MFFYFITLSSECLECAEIGSNFRTDQIRLLIILILTTIHCVVRGIRIGKFPAANSILNIAIFWGVNILTLSLLFRAVTTQLLFELVNIDGVFTLGIGAFMTIVAGLGNESILADLALLLKRVINFQNQKK